MHSIAPIISLQKNEVYTTSLIVAQVFEKSHKNVLQTIENLPKDNFGRLNFQPTSFKDKWNREQPMYKITSQGFYLLGMSFTGAKAYQFKILFIEAFDTAIKKINENKLNSVCIQSQNKFIHSLRKYVVNEIEKYSIREVFDRLGYKNRTITHKEISRYKSEITASEYGYLVSANYILKTYGNSIAKIYRNVIDKKTSITYAKTNIKIKNQVKSYQLELF
jgi:Rha family phage regulatory protein